MAEALHKDVATGCDMSAQSNLEGPIFRRRTFHMKARILSGLSETTHVLVFGTGEEVMIGLSNFAERHRLRASHFIGIGAFSKAILGFFNWQRKEYERIPILEQAGVLSLTGDIVFEQGKPKVHAYVVVGKADGTAHGGHLLEAHVHPTLEVILTESPKSLLRRVDSESGLALINLDSSPSQPKGPSDILMGLIHDT
jgi:predicted DNA-binding protein with PD1-like motif